MKFKLVGNSQIKMGTHAGIYTRSYQEARAIYDAKIRNWDIEYKDNLFFVENSDKKIERIYLDSEIENCSCLWFAEQECGTCQHIEAVKLMLESNFVELNKIRPIAYVNSNYAFKKKGTGEDLFKSPALSTCHTVKTSRTIPINLEEYADVNVLTEFDIILYEFQEISIRLMIKYIRSLLVLKMGLGKTICALICCKLLKKDKILIVVPTSLKYQWQQQIDRFNLGSSIVIEKKSDLKNYTDQRFLIVSYGMLNFNREILEEKFDICIIDEIQKISNQESKTWDTISQIKSEYLFSLSGTPIQNKLTDLLSIVQVLNPFELKPEWKFYEEFCNYSKAKLFGIRSDKLQDLKERLDRYLINPKIDYTKFKLPAKNEILISTRLNETQTEIHNNYFGQIQILLAKSMNTPLTFSEKIALNGLMTKARLAATDLRLIDSTSEVKSEKFEMVESIITTIIGRGKKVVVYSGWIKCLKLLVPFLEENGIGYVEFNGEVSAKQRDNVLQEFINEEDIRVFLSTDSGGQGIDGLQLACSEVIHIEKIWNPSKIEQRNGRMIRTLQPEKIVNVYKFETDAGIEKLISTNHERKHTLINDMIG